MADLWDLFPAVFLLAWAGYNWLAYKYPTKIPNPLGVDPQLLEDPEGRDMRDFVLDLTEDQEPHEGARVETDWDRSDPELRDRYKVKDVPLTIHQRQMLLHVIEEYLTKAGAARGRPEAEGWLRAAWWILVDLEDAKDLDEVEPPEPIDHEAWREAEAERTGTDPVTGTDVE